MLYDSGIALSSRRGLVCCSGGGRRIFNESKSKCKCCMEDGCAIVGIIEQVQRGH